mmetsp:Transcript_28675/g.86071  ORF Transcript_28675/g.86071 Transcript_28675/m.86071 type:complete len:378 (+) Transcript_28675:757-1890(+)
MLRSPRARRVTPRHSACMPSRRSHTLHFTTSICNIKKEIKAPISARVRGRKWQRAASLEHDAKGLAPPPHARNFVELSSVHPSVCAEGDPHGRCCPPSVSRSLDAACPRPNPSRPRLDTGAAESGGPNEVEAVGVSTVRSDLAHSRSRTGTSGAPSAARSRSGGDGCDCDCADPAADGDADGDPIGGALLSSTAAARAPACSLPGGVEGAPGAGAAAPAAPPSSGLIGTLRRNLRPCDCEGCGAPGTLRGADPAPGGGRRWCPSGTQKATGGGLGLGLSCGNAAAAAAAAVGGDVALVGGARLGLHRCVAPERPLTLIGDTGSSVSDVEASVPDNRVNLTRRFIWCVATRCWVPPPPSAATPRPQSPELGRWWVGLP